jgi:hypothetical protein
MNLTIVNGNITASSSSNGSGIGSGRGTVPFSSIVVHLSILGGTIRANGTLAGIGSGGEGGAVGQLTFSGTPVLICSCANAGKSPVNASSILFSDASAVFVTQRAPRFGVTPYHQGELNLTLVYETAMADKAELLPSSVIFLQIHNISMPDGRCEFCILSAASTSCFRTESTIARSLIVSLPSEGNYSIRARAEDFAGFLAIADDCFSFGVGSNGVTVSDAYFVSESTRTISASPGVTSATATASSTSAFTLPNHGSIRQGPAHILHIGLFHFWYYIDQP